mgnify:CR=1 FL=1
MLGVTDYGTFVVTVIVFLLIPGPGNLALITSTSKGGIMGGLGATLGVILAAVYLLFLFERVFLGAVTRPENNHLRDINPRELAALIPLLVLIFWIGLYPAPFLNLINPAATQIDALVHAATLALR